MADLSDPTTLSGLLQAGGVLAFAAATYLKLGKLEPILERIATTQAAQLERERARDEARARQLAQGWDDEETTPVHVPKFRRTNPFGHPTTGEYHVRPPRGRDEG